MFIVCYRNIDLKLFPVINFCGNILNIYEKSDPYGVSAIQRKINSKCEIVNFSELELNTGMNHEFLFKPLKEWIKPSIKWTKRNYSTLKNIR